MTPFRPFFRRTALPAAPLLLLIAALRAPAPAAAAPGGAGGTRQDLPDRVNIRLVSRLESELSRIERAAAACDGADPETVRNVTIPLQNHIEDMVLASGVYADIFPVLIHDIICIESRKGLTRQEIAILLLRYQKENRYRILLLDGTYDLDAAGGAADGEADGADGPAGDEGEGRP